MDIREIISSGAFGAESAAPDEAIKLGFQHGGYAPENVGRYGANGKCGTFSIFAYLVRHQIKNII